MVRRACDGSSRIASGSQGGVDHRRRCAIAVCGFAKPASPGTCTGTPVQESEHVASDRAQGRACRDLPLGMAAHALDRWYFESVVAYHPMPGRKQAGIVIRLAAEHHAVHVRELLRHLLHRAQPTIGDDRECRKLLLGRGPTNSDGFRGRDKWDSAIQAAVVSSRNWRRTSSETD